MASDVWPGLSATLSLVNTTAENAESDATWKLYVRPVLPVLTPLRTVKVIGCSANRICAFDAGAIATGVVNVTPVFASVTEDDTSSGAFTVDGRVGLLLVQAEAVARRARA